MQRITNDNLAQEIVLISQASVCESSNQCDRGKKRVSQNVGKMFSSSRSTLGREYAGYTIIMWSEGGGTATSNS